MLLLLGLLLLLLLGRLVGAGRLAVLLVNAPVPLEGKPIRETDLANIATVRLLTSMDLEVFDCQSYYPPATPKKFDLICFTHKYPIQNMNLHLGVVFEMGGLVEG